MIPKPMFSEDEVARYLDQRFGSLYALEWRGYAKKRFIDQTTENPPDWWSTIRLETTMLSWTAAKKAMTAEGFSFVMRFAGFNDDDHKAWQAGKGMSCGCVGSALGNPTEAINDLLDKCRKQWPAKLDPWDAMTLEQLINHCTRREWLVSFHRDDGYNWAHLRKKRSQEAIFNGNTHHEALVKAMKQMKIKP